jgi:hypothetical protein
MSDKKRDKPTKKEDKRPVKKWIGKVLSKMEKIGSVGKFSKEAANEGESTLEHAEEIKSSPKASTKLKKEAQFAINMSKLKKKKK